MDKKTTIINKKTTIIFVALLLLGIAVVASVLGFPGNWQNSQKNNAVTNALQAGDYNAYVTAYNDNINAAKNNILTQDQFNQLATQYQDMMTYTQQINNAIAAGDYNAWYNAEKSWEDAHSITNIITADNFNQYVNMINAQSNGDYQTANQIAHDLGLYGMGNMHGGMHGLGMRGMQGNGMMGQ